MRNYKCLNTAVFSRNTYKLEPLRSEDQFLIRKWRNEQINILRQKEKLTEAQQKIYFETVIANLFEVAQPKQVLFSFFENDVFIGYGGLVHIDWESKHGEISFLTETKRTLNPVQFKNDWMNYLTLLKHVAKNELRFNKIYTYAYSVRENLFPVLIEQQFVLEATLKKHVLINNQYEDVLIHSYFLNDGN
jgi:hypothetical protein